LSFSWGKEIVLTIIPSAFISMKERGKEGGRGSPPLLRLKKGGGAPIAIISFPAEDGQHRKKANGRVDCRSGQPRKKKKKQGRHAGPTALFFPCGEEGRKKKRGSQRPFSSHLKSPAGRGKEGTSAAVFLLSPGARKGEKRKEKRSVQEGEGIAAPSLVFHRLASQ